MPCEHVLLMHDGPHHPDRAILDYINDALDRGQLVVFGSVNLNVWQVRWLSSGITDYENNITSGNLLILNLGDFYEFASVGQLEPFEELGVIVEEMAKQRIAHGKSGELVLMGDIASCLLRNGKIDECILEERWWERAHHDWLRNGLKIAVICMYENPMNVRDSHFEFDLSKLHGLLITAHSGQNL